MANFQYSAIAGVPVVTYYDPSPPSVGEIKPYAGSTAPSGWAICNGQELNQTTYPDLFALLGSTYNTQTNPTTGSAWAAPSAGNFRVPDLRGIMLKGVGTPTGGDAVSLGGYQSDQNRVHAHAFSISTGSGGNNPPSTPSYLGYSTGNAGSANADVAIVVASGTQVRGYDNGSIAANGALTNIANSGGNETRPKNRGVNFIIRLFNPSYVSYGAGWATGQTPGLILQTEEVDLVCTGTNITNVRSVFVAKGYKNGRWRLEGNLYVTRSSGSPVTSATISIPGVTFKNISSFFQIITAGTNGAAGLTTGYVNPNANTITIEHSSFNSTIYYASLNVELESKPTWA